MAFMSEPQEATAPKPPADEFRPRRPFPGARGSCGGRNMPRVFARSVLLVRLLSPLRGAAEAGLGGIAEVVAAGCVHARTNRVGGIYFFYTYLPSFLDDGLGKASRQP